MAAFLISPESQLLAFPFLLTIRQSVHLSTQLHSGPVTAGVLKGDRARFQLFGDTVNTGALRAFVLTFVVDSSFLFTDVLLFLHDSVVLLQRLAWSLPE